jgi:hypothetical protein
VQEISTKNRTEEFTYQYLWDSQSNNLTIAISSGQSQQLGAKCN